VTVPVVVLSETRSMLKNTLHVPVIRSEGDDDASAGKVKEVLKDQETID